MKPEITQATVLVRLNSYSSAHISSENLVNNDHWNHNICHKINNFYICRRVHLSNLTAIIKHHKQRTYITYIFNISHFWRPEPPRSTCYFCSSWSGFTSLESKRASTFFFHIHALRPHPHDYISTYIPTKAPSSNTMTVRV